jgi:hypothetical protein
MISAMINERVIRWLCRVDDFQKQLDIPKNAGYVVNNFGAKYVDAFIPAREGHHGEVRV